ncbi:MAG: Fic/DOC family protein [Caulobacterales bacterium]
MYEAVEDPYCYPGSTVLRNIPDLRSAEELDRFEAAATTQRADEPLPAGRLSILHYCAIHRHLFQDVFAWAGRPRTVRLGKSGSAFCYPEHIEREMRALFTGLKAGRFLRGLPPDAFAAEAASFLATLNAIHPFREGNGRTQMTFLALLADQAGHSLHLDRLQPETFLEAMVASFRNQTADLTANIRRLIDEGTAAS